MSVPYRDWPEERKEAYRARVRAYKAAHAEEIKRKNREARYWQNRSYVAPGVDTDRRITGILRAQALERGFYE